MVSPRRIVFALVGDVRGSSRALRQLRWLAGGGYEVEALMLPPPSSSRPPPSAPPLPEGVRLHVLEHPGGRGPRFFWAAHRTFRRAASALRADAYHASDLYTLPALAAAARRHGGRLLFDSRELYPHVDATAGKPWASWTWSAVERVYVPRCDAVFTVNRSIAERIAHAYGVPEPVVVHNLPVHPAPPPSDALRRQLSIPPAQRIVLYQGLFREGRGLEVLIEAVREVPEAALVLIGEGPLRDDLARQLEVLGGRGHLLPFTPPDALLPLTASADVGVCVLEPISESVRLALPNKLFEYVGAGLPVVVSDLPELRRVVEAFDVGLVVPPKDPAALAAALRRALTDADARARWKANVPRLLAHFDPERDRERFLGVYERLFSD